MCSLNFQIISNAVKQPHLVSCVCVCVCVCVWFPGGSNGKESACNTEDLTLIPGLGRSPGEENKPTPVFLLRELHGQRSLVGYSLWGCKESNTT